MLFVVSVIPFNSAVVKMGLQTAANCLRLVRPTGSRSAPKGGKGMRAFQARSLALVHFKGAAFRLEPKVGSEGTRFPRVGKAGVGSIITSL